MERTAQSNFFVISIVPIEAGDVLVTMHVDFEGCQGRDMLGLNPVDFLVFEKKNLLQIHTQSKKFRRWSHFCTQTPLTIAFVVAGRF